MISSERNKIINKFGREIAVHEAAIVEHNRRSGDFKFDLLVLVEWMVQLSIGAIVGFVLFMWWLV